jgi:hypothetical protein
LNHHFLTSPVTLATFLLVCFGGIQTCLCQSVDNICGDVDGDQTVIVSDAIFLVNYIFIDGPAPDPLSVGDCDLDGLVTIGDAVWIINYIFLDGPAPCQLAVELSAFCLDGRPLVQITNKTREMDEPRSYSIQYENGSMGGGEFQLLEGETDTLGLSNLYGTGLFTIPAFGHELEINDCLTPFVDDLIEQADFNDYIVNPVFADLMVDVGIFTCTYDFYLDSLDYDSASVGLTPTAGGMIMQALYHHVSANFEIDVSPQLLCPDGIGSLTIDSLLVGSEMSFNIINADSVDVVFDSVFVMYEADIELEGSLAAVVGSEFSIAVADTSSPLGVGMVELFQSLAEPLLEKLLIP